MTAPAPSRPRRLAGVALTSDTVSANRRLYRRPVVEAACARAQDRIAAGRLLMCASHGAADQDDPLSVVGRVVEMSCDHAGALRYIAEEAPTRAGREVFDLCSGPQSHLAVSIRGRWIGPLVREDGPDGLGPVEHSPDGLELLGLDTTLSPGIESATARVVERLRDPLAIRESVTVDLGDTSSPTAAERLDRWFSAQVAEQRAARAAQVSSAIDRMAARVAAGGDTDPTTAGARRELLAAWVMAR